MGIPELWILHHRVQSDLFIKIAVSGWNSFLHKTFGILQLQASGIRAGYSTWIIGKTTQGRRRLHFVFWSDGSMQKHFVCCSEGSVQKHITYLRAFKTIYAFISEKVNLKTFWFMLEKFLGEYCWDKYWLVDLPARWCINRIKFLKNSSSLCMVTPER